MALDGVFRHTYPFTPGPSKRARYPGHNGDQNPQISFLNHIVPRLDKSSSSTPEWHIQEIQNEVERG